MDTIKAALHRFKKLVDSLECECDEYNGYVCPLHSDSRLANLAIAEFENLVGPEPTPCIYCGDMPEFTNEEGKGDFAGLRKIGISCGKCGASLTVPGYVAVGREDLAQRAAAEYWNIAFGRNPKRGTQTK